MRAWTNPVTDNFGPLGSEDTGRRLNDLYTLVYKQQYTFTWAFGSTWVRSHPFLRICTVLSLTVIAIFCAVYAVLERRCVQ